MAFQGDKFKDNGPAGREAYKQVTQTDGTTVSVPYVAVHTDLGFSSGGGGGGVATIADGADVAQGTTTDAAYASGAGTLVSLLKGIFGKLAGTLNVSISNAPSVSVSNFPGTQPVSGSVSVSNLPVTQAVSIADGSSVGQGATSASAYTDGTGAASGTMIALLKGAFVKLAAILTALPASLGQKTKANSLAVTLASDQDSLGVTVGNFPATQATSLADGQHTSFGAKADTAWDGSAASASGVAIWKYIGTKIEAVRSLLAGTLSISASNLPLPTGAATESTLSSLNTKTPSLGQATMTSSSPVVIASNQSAISVTDTRLPSVLGQAAMSASLPVALASDQGAIATSVADGSNVAQGATSATVYSDSTGATAGSMIALLKGCYKLLSATLTVGGNSSLVAVTPTISTSPAYSSGDVVGTKLTLASAVRLNNTTAVLQSLFVVDKGNQKAPLEVLLFDSDPTAGTYTDNAAISFSTDISKLIGRITVAASDYTTLNSIATAELRGLGKLLKANGGNTSLYAVVVTTGTPTYLTTADLVLSFGFMKD